MPLKGRHRFTNWEFVHHSVRSVLGLLFQTRMISLFISYVLAAALLFAILPLALSPYYRWHCRNPSSYRLPPGPPCLPLIGNLGLLRGSGLERLRHMAKLVDQYGENGAATLQFGPGKSNTVVFIKDPETIKRALSQDAFAGRPKTFIRDGYYQRIVFADGELWKEHRRFALSTLRDFGLGKSWVQDLILDEARELVNDFRALNGKPINPTEIIVPSVCNVVCGISYGQRFSHQDTRFVRLTELIGANLHLSAKCQPVDFFPFLRHIPFTNFKSMIKEWTDNHDEIADFLQDLVDEHRKSFRPTDDDPTDYIDAFLKQQHIERNKAGSTFTDRQLILSIYNFFGAGTETTSTTLCWAIYYMLENPDVLVRVQKEIDSVLGERLFPFLEDKERLPYCQATITEVQRLGNLVPVPGRSTVEDAELNGFTIPKDTKIAPLIMAMHEDPKLFPEPMKFKPERFLDAHGQFISKVDWLMPFGSGKRQCLGESLARMELFLFFVTLARNFTLGPMLSGEVISGHALMRIVNCPKPFHTSFIPRS